MINRHFPNFHPLSGEQKDIPVYVSLSQIAEVQGFLLSHSSEAEIVAAIDELKSLPPEESHSIFPKASLFPTKLQTSHRAAIGKLYSLNLFKNHKHPKAFSAALLIMIKVNQMLNVIPCKYDHQLLDYPIRKDEFLKSCEAADIALAIADAFGEFKLALGNIESTIVARQELENQVMVRNARKANDIKHLPLKMVYEKLTLAVANKRLLADIRFQKGNSGKVNYTELAKYLFWYELVEEERAKFSIYKKIASMLDIKANTDSIAAYCKKADIRFNPYTAIANELKSHSKKLLTPESN